MIGAAARVAVVVLAGACLAARPADPMLADPPTAQARQAWAQIVATDASRLLTDLLQALDVAIEHGRNGTARTVAGDEPAEPEYLAAAAALEALADETDGAAIAVAHLAGVLEALDPARRVGPLGISSADLLGIAAQLRESAEAAGPFVATRRATEATLAALAAALAALDADDLPVARDALERASNARAAVAAWGDAPVTMPFWLETTSDMVGALERLIAATTAGDSDAAGQAAADYADAADEAHQADLALAISLSEAGSAIARTPLRRLTSVVDAVSQAHLAAASVIHPG